MTKYSKSIEKHIIELIETDAYTISDICDIVRISRKIFYEWKNTIPEFTEAVTSAEKHCREILLMKARLALSRKVDGYKQTSVTYKYVEDEYGELKLKEKTVKEKDCPPDIKTIMQIIERDEVKQSENEVNHQIVKPIVLTVSSEEERAKYQPVVDEFIDRLKDSSTKIELTRTLAEKEK